LKKKGVGHREKTISTERQTAEGGKKSGSPKREKSNRPCLLGNVTTNT